MYLTLLCYAGRFDGIYSKSTGLNGKERKYAGTSTNIKNNLTPTPSSAVQLLLPSMPQLSGFALPANLSQNTVGRARIIKGEPADFFSGCLTNEQHQNTNAVKSRILWST